MAVISIALGLISGSSVWQHLKASRIINYRIEVGAIQCLLGLQCLLLSIELYVVVCIMGGVCASCLNIGEIMDLWVEKNYILFVTISQS